MVQDLRPARWPILLGALALTYLVAVLFLPILGFELVDLDVNTSVVYNPYIRGLTGENLKRILTSRCIESYGALRPESFLAPEVILGGGALGLTGVALWKLRRQKLILFGLLWFGLALGPTAQVLPHHVHRADRFLYLPLVGLAAALACGIRPLGRVLRTRLAALGAAALGVGALWPLYVRSSDQVETWQNGVTVWQNCAEVSPDNAFVHDILARNLKRRGRLRTG